MQNSLQITPSAHVQYLLRIADSCLIQSQRLSEWCGHAPVLEEDIALTNIALDLIGQARAVLTLAGKSTGHDEDQLAFLRDERDYLNVTLVELPNGSGQSRDFAFTVIRNAIMATFFKHLWQGLCASSDAELAAIAGKAIKEARYHQEHSCDWVVRLAGGTETSRKRIEAALSTAWLYTPELFGADTVDDEAHKSGLGIRWRDVQAPWLADMKSLLSEAGLGVPADAAFRSTSKTGRHSEHMGYILAEMQHLQRSYPGGVW